MSQHHTGPASLADPFSDSTRLAHDHAAVSSSSSLDGESAMLRAVESSVVRKIFGGNDVSRRSFMKMLGASSAMAVINSIFPLDAAKAMALDAIGPIEKKDVKIGFMPLTCGTPIVMAHPMGFYKKYGLTEAQPYKASGWAMIRDWAVSGQTDYTQMLAPMPIAMTLGLGSPRMPFLTPALENVNGQAITCAWITRTCTPPRT